MAGTVRYEVNKLGFRFMLVRNLRSEVERRILTSKQLWCLFPILLASYQKDKTSQLGTYVLAHTKEVAIAYRHRRLQVAPFSRDRCLENMGPKLNCRGSQTPY
jgi:hypothetical protein